MNKDLTTTQILAQYDRLHDKLAFIDRLYDLLLLELQESGHTPVIGVSDSLKA